MSDDLGAERGCRMSADDRPAKGRIARGFDLVEAVAFGLPLLLYVGVANALEEWWDQVCCVWRGDD